LTTLNVVQMTTSPGQDETTVKLILDNPVAAGDFLVLLMGNSVDDVDITGVSGGGFTWTYEVDEGYEGAQPRSEMWVGTPS
jgi:hypothetical protein